MPRAYYNEFDPFAAQWLRNLIDAGLVAPGDVDERSIVDVRPSDLAGYTQVHLFAGIGVWSYALRLAGWPDSRRVWTASLPCQPFSPAGKRKGRLDERNLLGVFLELVRECRPPELYGEQVSSADAVGRSQKGDAATHMQRLWARQAALSVCQDWMEGNFPIGMQGMSEREGPGVQRDPGSRSSVPGKALAEWCQDAQQEVSSPLRSDRGLGVGAADARGVRGDWPPVRHDVQEVVGVSERGSDSAGLGVHQSELPTGPVWLEYRTGGLGGRANAPDRSRYYREKAEGVRRALEENGRDIVAQAGWSWVDTLQLEMEAADYTFGAHDLCAAGVGAPHIRQRLYWYARRLDDGHHPGLEGLGGGPVGAAGQRQGKARPAAQAGGAGGLAHDERRGRTGGHGGPAQPQAGLAGTDGLEGRLADEHGDGRPEARQRVAQAGGDGVERDGAAVGVGHAGGQSGQRDTRGVRGAQAQGAGPGRADGGVGDGHPDAGDADRPGPTNGRWAAADWLWCRDEKWRPVESGTCPLADRAANHVGVLRAYGNAIVSELAVAYIQATQAGGES